MPREERWTSWLSGVDRLEVRLSRERRRVLNFAVQYIAQISDEWHPIVRFDTAHQRPHMDVLSARGAKETTELNELDKARAFTYAISDIKARWQFYRERYERALRE